MYEKPAVSQIIIGKKRQKNTIFSDSSSWLMVDYLRNMNKMNIVSSTANAR